MGLVKYTGNLLNQSQNSSYRSDIGKWAEDLVCKKLVQKGLTIVDRNIHCPIGEFDILAKDKSRHLLVEVRCRRLSNNYDVDKLSLIPEILPAKKRMKLKSLFNYYSNRYSYLRIDFCLVLLFGKNVEILYFDDIFQYFD